jgi:hypothetical protein
MKEGGVTSASERRWDAADSKHRQLNLNGSARRLKAPFEGLTNLHLAMLRYAAFTEYAQPRSGV